MIQFTELLFLRRRKKLKEALFMSVLIGSARVLVGAVLSDELISTAMTIQTGTEQQKS
jgi:hypothetical protein